MAKARMASIPMKKYGKEDKIMNTGGSTLSKAPPRYQAPTIPIMVPMAKAMRVVTPTRPRVQGRAPATTLLTEVGKKVRDEPKWPVKLFARYAPYWAGRLEWVFTPNAASMAVRAWPESFP